MFLLFAFPFRTVPTLAETIHVRPSTILNPLHDSLGVKLYHIRCVPRELACHLKEKRVVMCRDLLERLQMEDTFRFARVVIGDESWLYLNCSQTHMWSVPDDERRIRVDETIASEKHMLTVLWPIKGR
jgi:hypothetical protein